MPNIIEVGNKVFSISIVKISPFYISFCCCIAARLKVFFSHFHFEEEERAFTTIAKRSNIGKSIVELSIQQSDFNLTFSSFPLLYINSIYKHFLFYARCLCLNPPLPPSS